jgi:nitrate reductase NapE component
MKLAFYILACLGAYGFIVWFVCKVFGLNELPDIDDVNVDEVE